MLWLTLITFSIIAIWTSSSSLVPRAILLLSLGSYLGGSMFLSVMQDLIGLSTLHLTVISWIMRQIYRWEVSAMYSLWNLFRGKHLRLTKCIRSMKAN
jgi:hypothetical protein